MRDFRDFDRRFEQRRKRFDRMWRIGTTAIVVIWAVVIVAGAWLLFHPEAISSWYGRLFAAFAGGARGLR